MKNIMNNCNKMFRKEVIVNRMKETKIGKTITLKKTIKELEKEIEIAEAYLKILDMKLEKLDLDEEEKNEVLNEQNETMKVIGEMRIMLCKAMLYKISK